VRTLTKAAVNMDDKENVAGEIEENAKWNEHNAVKVPKKNLEGGECNVKQASASRGRQKNNESEAAQLFLKQH